MSVLNKQRKHSIGIIVSGLLITTSVQVVSPTWADTNTRSSTLVAIGNYNSGQQFFPLSYTSSDLGQSWIDNRQWSKMVQVITTKSRSLWFFIRSGAH